MKEILLGFDARSAAPPFEAAYRSTYLLRDDVERVFSADSMLWPSAVEDSPAWIGMNAPFWEDLLSLERHVAGGGSLAPRFADGDKYFERSEIEGQRLGGL